MKPIWSLCAGLILLLNGCGITPDPQDPARFLENAPGTDRTAKAFSYTDRGQVQGWRIWHIEGGERAACLALRPAQQAGWPVLDYGVDFIAGQGGGFMMYYLAGLAVPHHGFYGPMPLVTETALRFADTDTLTYIIDLEQVRGWSGRQGRFAVVSEPDPDAPPNLIDDLFERVTARGVFDRAIPETGVTHGVMDFTGVDQAIDLLEQCRRHYF